MIKDMFSFSSWFFNSFTDSRKNFALNFSVFLNPNFVEIKFFGSIFMNPIILSELFIALVNEVLSSTLKLFLNHTKLFIQTLCQ